MKSKSFDLPKDTPVKLEQNKTFDFINYYPSSAETKTPTKKKKTSESHDIKSESPKRERSPYKRNKKKQAVELSQINTEGPSGSSSGVGCSTPVTEPNKTSTPFVNKKSEKVKSIMKNNSVMNEDPADSSVLEVSTSKPKKRNKSVSFMLEDNEDVIVKKTKSEDSLDRSASKTKVKANKLKKIKKHKKDKQAEKENKIKENGQIENTDNVGKQKKDRKSNDKQDNHLSDSNVEAPDVEPNPEGVQEKKKRKHMKKSKKQEDNPSEVKQTEPEKPTKAKKQKREAKSQTEMENGEPASKSRKKDIKPEIIAEDLENLSIGDNAHTLSNLLDEMTVADKDKRKKLRKRVNKNKKDRDEDSKSADEVKEKKWKKKRWNKEKRDTTEGLATSVIVENLPLSMLFSYKKVLAEHFARCGLLRNVGIAELYPTEVSVPVFTTTIYFDNEEAATKALNEDNTSIEGSTIRVKRPLPPTETTAVVRTYGQLTEQGVSSAFHSAGRIRSIRISSKGKNTMSTAFVEFDGPTAVENAIKMATDTKIGGKKIHVSKFEIRKKKVEKSSESVASDADQSDDSQN